MELNNYVLAQEIVQKEGFSQANISVILKTYNLIEYEDYYKVKGAVFINKHSNRLPRFIKNSIKRHNFTDLKNLIYIQEFIELFESYAKIKEKITIINICNKKFIKIKDKWLEDIVFNNNLTKVSVHKKEIPELIRGDYIKGYIQTGSSKCLVWY